MRSSCSLLYFCLCPFTAILYWPYHAELTNNPSFGVNQKMNDSEAACCGAEALGLRLGTTGCATGKQ